MLEPLLVSLAALVAIIFGWNNSSLLIGNTRGSGTLTLKESLGISSVGLVLGVFLEGSKMANSVNGSLASGVTAYSLAITLAVTIAIMFCLTLLKLPVSLSMVVVAAFTGAAYGSQLSLKTSHLASVLAFWFLAPVITGILTFVTYLIFSRTTPRFSLISVDTFNRTGVIASSVAVSAVMGANNVGLIYGTTITDGTPEVEPYVLLAFAALAVVGMVVLGRDGWVSGTVGDKLVALTPEGVMATFLCSAIVVWFGTQLALPISITQCLLGGMLGAAFTKHIRLINRKIVLETTVSWILVPSAAFVISFALTALG